MKKEVKGNKGVTTIIRGIDQENIDSIRLIKLPQLYVSQGPYFTVVSFFWRMSIHSFHDQMKLKLRNRPVPSDRFQILFFFF